MRWAVVAAVAVTLVVSPGAYAQQNPVLPGMRMIELDGRAVRVQTIGLQERRPGAPVIVFEAGASNALEIGRQYTPVDSIATCDTRASVSHAASASSPLAVVENDCV